MPYYRQVGELPPKRHTQFRRPDGGLYAEELMGADGFSAESALLYHEHLPTAIVDSRVWEEPAEALTANHPLLPRHLRTSKLDTGSADPITGRQLLLANDDVRISYAVADRPSPLYRNAVGDECVYVESGSATVETVFGALTARQGDYVLLPTSTTHRWVPTGDGPLRTLAVQAGGHIGAPRRYLSPRGQFLESAPYCERDLRGPTEPLQASGLRRRGAGAAPGRDVGADLRGPPVRRGRLGRLPVSVHVQRRGLRADHRAGAPAAAGAPDVRGAAVRDLLVRAAEGRLPPAGGADPVQPRERGLGRGAVLRGRGLRGAARVGDRAGVDLAAPERVHARAAAGGGRAGARGGAVRGAGGHGRHVPPALARARRPGLRRPRLRLDLVRPPRR